MNVLLRIGTLTLWVAVGLRPLLSLAAILLALHAGRSLSRIQSQLDHTLKEDAPDARTVPEEG